MTRALRAGLLGCALLLWACAANEQREAASPTQDAGEWLAAVQQAHRRTDEALQRGELEVAGAALRDALALRVPPEVAAEHARVVQQDLWFRLCGVDMRVPDRRETALYDAERGLALGRGADLFTSNLLAARGRALQALGRDTEAASSYHEALAIDERLLQAALGRGQAGGP